MDLASLARSIRLLLISLVGVAAVAHAQACGVDDGLSSFVDDDAGRAIDHGDAFANVGDGGPSLGTLRLAHLAPELGSIDFCYAPPTGSYVGPVLHEVAYATVTKYVTLEATGTITIGIVRAGATTCTNPIAEGVVTLDPGKLVTIALFGSPPFALDGGVEAGDAGGAGDTSDAGDASGGGDSGAPPILAFVDDRETRADHARVRMIHASTAGPLVVRAASTLVADQLEPHRASAASQAVPVDELGFASIVPVPPPASIAIEPAGWASAPIDLDLRGDSLHTGFVLDGPDGGFEVLWCADKTTTAELTACIRVR
jgi:hypothetical protein